MSTIKIILQQIPCAFGMRKWLPWRFEFRRHGALVRKDRRCRVCGRHQVEWEVCSN